jgi:membrane-associated protease RseP (regulator of RpoE activity)
MAKNKYGEIIYQNQITGMAPYKRSTLIGIEVNSLADRFGFKTGDLIKEFDGQEIKTWEELEESLAMLSSGLRTDAVAKTASGGTLPENVLVKVLRDKEDIELSLGGVDIKKLSSLKGSKSRLYSSGKVYVKDNYYSFANRLGFFPSELFVSEFVKEDSPALKAGMQKGDRIVAINGKILRGFQTLNRQLIMQDVVVVN